MNPDRIQAAIDVAGWLEWIIRRTSALLLVLIVVSVVLNFGKLGLLFQVCGALLGIALVNVLATALKCLACSLKV